MAIKYRETIGFNDKLSKKEQFIWNYGAFNCKILKFKDAETVIDIMEKYDSLDSAGKEFIKTKSDKRVLCHILDDGESKDIFVYGDDNIPFRKECFV